MTLMKDSGKTCRQPEQTTWRSAALSVVSIRTPYGPLKAADDESPKFFRKNFPAYGYR
jgi:hypothetical protein